MYHSIGFQIVWGPGFSAVTKYKWTACGEGETESAMHQGGLSTSIGEMLEAVLYWSPKKIKLFSDPFSFCVIN